MDQSSEVTRALLRDKEANEEHAATTDGNVTPFAVAGVCTTMLFSWLNPLMKKGKEKVIADEDIPPLRPADRARTCHIKYTEQLRKRESQGSLDTSSMLPILLHCYRGQLLVSGFFALIKVLTLATGPLFLRAFIELAERRAASQPVAYAACALAVALFLAKCLESLSERQWYFMTRLIGLQLRALLSAAVYRKQLLLSTAAKMSHSPGEVVNYVSIDAYKLGEFPYWLHQTWTTCLLLCLALAIVYYSVGLATVAAVAAIVLTMVASSPLAKLQHRYQRMLMEQRDKRVKAILEALGNMKVMKLYAWEAHFRDAIEGLRREELRSIAVILFQRGCHMIVFWSSPILVSAVTFWTCYLLRIPLYASNVFTFLATLRIVQEPVRLIPDIFTAFIEAKLSLDRIADFLGAPELQEKNAGQGSIESAQDLSVFVSCSEISWDAESSSRATLRDVNLTVGSGERVAICGEVGSGKSTLLAAILGEVPKVTGRVNVYGTTAFVSQTAWIQTGSIRENILFGSAMDPAKYQEVLRRCSLVKDLDMLPLGDLTEIGERGVNLSGGQKQRVQLARALYRDADVYLLDDPFSAVDANTATSLFNDYIMEALSGKTVLLVTHQVDFHRAFKSILFMSSGRILGAGSYNEMLTTCEEFQELVNAHNKATLSERHIHCTTGTRDRSSKAGFQKAHDREQLKEFLGSQLIKKEEKETGDIGFKPYTQYLSHRKGYLYCFLTVLFHFLFIVGQLVQNYFLAADIVNPDVGKPYLLTLYSLIGCFLAFLMLFRSLYLVKLGCEASHSIFSVLMSSLFRAPMSFYDSTPLGRILSRVSADLSVVDLEVALKLSVALGFTINTYSSLALLTLLAWPVVFAVFPLVYLTVVLQRYYFATAKELMRINGTTKSSVIGHLSESVAGATTIRAFGQEDRFFSEHLNLVDANASAYFHSFSANEWLIQRLEIPCAAVLSASALAMTLLPLQTSDSGFVGMALSYGLSLNVFLITSIQFQCFIADSIVSVERLEQYMHIPSEAPEVIEANRPKRDWPSAGRVEICNLEVRYQPGSPLVLRGISCRIEGGHKVGIVGRTGSGKTTLISTLFRLVEPSRGRIIVDGINICEIGVHDLRSRLGIIPQDPTLFTGSVRYNLDPLCEHSDQEIWEFLLPNLYKVLKRCQLLDAIQQKEDGLNTSVERDGSNWSMGQRQLFCLGRALLKNSKILVLDEATASIDNATDAILQSTIRTGFAGCTVITVAHRIPTVMNCNMVLAISDGKLVEYDQPLELISKKGSLFGQLVKEHWSRRNTYKGDATN